MNSKLCDATLGRGRSTSAAKDLKSVSKPLLWRISFNGRDSLDGQADLVSIKTIGLHSERSATHWKPARLHDGLFTVVYACVQSVSIGW